jgi:predicted SAM-dependent methyltransferase
MSIRSIASVTLRLSAMAAWERVQQARWTLKRQGQIKAYLAGNQTRKLQIGAGFHALEGWLNTDLLPRGRQFVFMDATQPFPFPDDSFDYIFSEHIIEHVPYLAGRSLLQESFRVLRPGGCIRIATPDLQVLLGLNSPVHSESQSRYMKWVTTNFLPGIETALPIFVINNAFRNWGHQFLYDRQTLADLLAQSGFADITACESGQSADPVLAGIDSHGSYIAEQEMNRFESMILEAKKL